MAESDRIKLAMAEETTFGVAPTGTYQLLRAAGETMSSVPEFDTSKELQSTGQVTDVVRMDLKTGGGFTGELSYGTFDECFRYLLRSAGWSSVVNLTGVTCTFAAPANTITRSSGNWVTDGLAVGQWILISETASNNGLAKITALTTTVITVSHKTLVAEAGVLTTVNMGAQIVNGTTYKSVTMEVEFTDLSNTLKQLVGKTFDTMNMTVNRKGFIQLEFGLQGKKENSLTAAVGSAYTAATTTGVMNAVDNVLGIFEDGSSIDLTTLRIGIANNLRDRGKIGTLGPTSYGRGKINVSGAKEAYFESATQINKFLNNQYISFTLQFSDDLGNKYVFEIPSAKLTSGSRNATGENTDIMTPFDWTARRHATEGITMRIARFPAA